MIAAGPRAATGWAYDGIVPGRGTGPEKHEESA